MRRTLAILAVVVGFGAAALVAITMFRPPVTEPVSIPVRPTPAQLERLQAEITADLTATPDGGAWAVAVGAGVVEVTLAPGQEALGARLRDRYGERVVVRFGTFVG